MFRSLFYACLFGLLASTVTVHAAVVEIQPGKWKMTSNTVMPMLAQPRVDQRSQCIQQSTFDPMQAFSKVEQCKVDVVEQTSRRLKMNVSCAGEGMPPLSGHLVFQYTKSTMDGEMHLETMMQGMPFIVDTTITGVRVGECD